MQVNQCLVVFNGVVMLVTFSCDAYENITMFGNVALQLLTMMGESGTIPSAILAPDVEEALAKLEKAIKQSTSHYVSSRMDDTDETEISLSHRAIPLIKLLQAAIKNNCDVMWS